MIALQGPLAAGKTTFARGFVSYFGDAAVSSPSFTIARLYPTTPPVAHLDFYRLSDPDEAAELGLADYFSPRGIALVEWADRFPQLLPSTYKTLRFSVEADGSRRIEIF